jgi:iron complex outermembrane receptor protein
MRFSVQGQHRDNWIYDPIDNTHNAGYDDWAARVQLLYRPTDIFSALFNVHGRTLNGTGDGFHANIMQPGSDGQLVPGFDPSKTYTDARINATHSTLGANIHLTWDFPSLTVKSITGYESIRHDRLQGDVDGGHGPGNVFCNLSNSCGPPLSGPGYIPFAVAGGRRATNYQLTQEIQLISTSKGRFSGQTGVFVFYDDTRVANDDDNQTGTQVIDNTISVQRNNAEAIFGHLEYRMLDTLKLSGGVRFTRDAKNFLVPFSNVVPPLPQPLSAAVTATKLNWDLTAAYQPGPDLNIYARAATGFRAPSFGPPAAGPPPVPVQVARAEDNISYEVGIKADLFDHRARAAFDVYYFDVSHQQLTAVGGAANVTQLLNSKDTIGKGAELDFQANLTKNLSLTLSSSYNYTRISDPDLSIAPCFDWSFAVPGLKCTELSPRNANGLAKVDGSPLPEAPRFVADASLRYSIPIRGGSELYAFTDWSYRTRMSIFLDSEKEFTAPALLLGGFRIGYLWTDRKYEVAAFCRNCTNNIRLIYGINFNNFTGSVNEPRIVGAQLTARF